MSFQESISPYIQRLKNSPLFKDSMWSLIGSTVGRGLSLVAGILVARFLGKEIYGEYGIIKTTLIYIEIFSTFGLGYTATKYIADYKNTNPEKVAGVCNAALRITLATSGLMALIVLVFAEQIADIIDAPHLYNTLRITAAGVIVNAINIAQIGILSGFAEFKTIARNTTISGFVTFVLTATLTYIWGLNGAVIALVLSYGTQCIINNFSVRALLRPYEKLIGFQRGLYKELVSFSFPIALQESLYSMTSWVISFMLIKLTGYGELGLYSAASQWAAIISFIPGILRNVTLSHLSSNMTNRSAHDKTMKAMLLVNILSTAVMFLGVVVFRNFICSFYGDSFEGLKSVLLVLTFTTISSNASNVYVQEFMAQGKNWFVFICKIIRDVGTLGLAYYVIVNVNSKGALILAASTCIANIVFISTLAIRYYIQKNSLEYILRK